MNAILPRGAGAVMASRDRKPPNALDFFPTPPWATRALFPILRDLDSGIARASIAEPCAGEGHMAEVLCELSPYVLASDVFDYGRGYALLDCLDPAAEDRLGGVDWTVTNPPFLIADQIIKIALQRSKRGVAMLVRLQFVESDARYRSLFEPHPPRIVAVFSERCAMKRGEWDPDGSTATAYAWVIWTREHGDRPTEFRWIPPGQKVALTHPTDRDRFAKAKAAPLFDGVEADLMER